MDWDEKRYHAPDDWLECNGCIVTDTAVGETGWCCLNGIDRRLASFSPSNWEFTPVRVELVSGENTRKHADVENYWDAAVFQNFLEKAPLPLESWEKPRESAVARFTGLFFAEDAFDFLKGHPFSPSAAQRILFIFDVLNRIKGCFDEHGERTAEGHKIYQDFFTGKKGDGGRGSLFAPSSEQDKNDFKKALTFRHPENPGDDLFCPLAWKDSDPATARPFFMAGSVRRASVYRLCGAKNYKAMRNTFGTKSPYSWRRNRRCKHGNRGLRAKRHLSPRSVLPHCANLPGEGLR